MFKLHTPRYFLFKLAVFSHRLDVISPWSHKRPFLKLFHIYRCTLKYLTTQLIAAAQALSTMLIITSKNSTVLEIKEIAFSTRQMYLIKWYT